MSDIIDFKPKAALEPAEQLEVFIEWAKAILPKGIPDRVHEGIQWDMNSWHRSGMTSTPFTAFDSPRKGLAEPRQYMQRSMMDFAKAILVYHRVYRGQKSVRTRLDALRVLEVALLELTGAGDVTQLTAAVCISRARQSLMKMPAIDMAMKDRKVALKAPTEKTGWIKDINKANEHIEKLNEANQKLKAVNQELLARFKIWQTNADMHKVSQEYWINH